MSSAETVRELFDAARAQGRSALLEPDALAVARALGLTVPASLLVRSPAEARAVDLGSLGEDRVVVKVVSADIPHKSDVGGVRVVAATPQAVAFCVAEMQRRLADHDLAGFSVSRFVAYDSSPGGELLVGTRWTEEFGPVVIVAPGGVHAELLTSHLAPGRDVGIVSAATTDAETWRRSLSDKAIVRLATGRLRGREPRLPWDRLEELVRRFAGFARDFGEQVAEFEINPVALAADGPIALDALLRLRGPGGRLAPPRPLHKLDRLLRPHSIAVVGVSERLNPGHVIVNNTLDAGFDRERLWVVKPGRDRLEGCRCFPDLASLPERVDLMILAIDAAQATKIVQEAVDRRAAESLIVIPGGLGERRGTSERVGAMQTALANSRTSDWQGPLINGGNCLGIRSVPGRYDTTFVPQHKFPASKGATAPLAILSQSGAFNVARQSKLHDLKPKYLISIGNQIDLTLGDYLTQLREDEEIEVFACYLEGFRALDGRRWLDAAAAITASGRRVILYRAGRTEAGRRATVSHTASVAGDYAVTRELSASAGVVVAETLADFEDLTRTFCLLRRHEVRGWRLGAMSNAGFECVAIADRLGRFTLQPYGPTTAAGVETLFRRARIEGVVAVQNPLDVTPILGDEGFAEAARLVLEDEAVDVGVIGCVPHTGALETLESGESHGEDLGRAESVVQRLVRLGRQTRKAWVAIVDAGPMYDAAARTLEAQGVPTFRTADRAMRILERFCASRLGSTGT